MPTVTIGNRDFDVDLDGDMLVVGVDGSERGRMFVGELSEPETEYVTPDPEMER